MNFRSKNGLLILAALLIIVVSTVLYLTNASPSSSESIIHSENESGGSIMVESVNIQNNVLTDYFNSLYDSQVYDIEVKYNEGSISREERDKQLNAVTKNRELTINTLNKLSNAKKDIFTGNITRQDILLRLKSFNDIDSDIKTELNATLNGY
jgi:hypothetical protein